MTDEFNLFTQLVRNDPPKHGETNMTQHSYLPLAFKTNLEKHPNDFVVTDATCAEVEQRQKKHRAAMAKLNPVMGLPPNVELTALRKQLFDLQQNAKGCENRVNNEAGNVRLLEERVNTAIKHKQTEEGRGNLLGARSYERQSDALEVELLDARERLFKKQRFNSAAVRELRNWLAANGDRLEELKTIKTLPTKSVNEPK